MDELITQGSCSWHHSSLGFLPTSPLPVYSEVNLIHGVSRLMIHTVLTAYLGTGVEITHACVSRRNWQLNWQGEENRGFSMSGHPSIEIWVGSRDGQRLNSFCPSAGAGAWNSLPLLYCQLSWVYTLQTAVIVMVLRLHSLMGHKLITKILIMPGTALFVHWTMYTQP